MAILKTNLNIKRAYITICNTPCDDDLHTNIGIRF